MYLKLPKPTLHGLTSASSNLKTIKNMQEFENLGENI